MVRVPVPVPVSAPSAHCTVMAYTPGATEAVVDTVRVEGGNALPPFEVKVAGVKLAVAPGGRPEMTLYIPLTVPLPCLIAVAENVALPAVPSGKRAALGAYVDVIDARRVRKVNIRLHRGLADSSHMELGALRVCS